MLENGRFIGLFDTPVHPDLALYFRTASVRELLANADARTEKVLQPCPSYHANATAIGYPFGASLTGSVSRREPRWVFDEALTPGS